MMDKGFKIGGRPLSTIFRYRAGRILNLNPVALTAAWDFYTAEVLRMLYCSESAFVVRSREGQS